MKNEGVMILVISLATLFIGIFDILWNQNYASLTMVIFSGAGFAGGFYWISGNNPRFTPLFYFLFGLFLALGFLWQGIFTGTIIWLIVSACVFLLFCVIAWNHRIKPIGNTRGDRDV